MDKLTGATRYGGEPPETKTKTDSYYSMGMVVKTTYTNGNSSTTRQHPYLRSTMSHLVISATAGPQGDELECYVERRTLLETTTAEVIDEPGENGLTRTRRLTTVTTEEIFEPLTIEEATALIDPREK